MVFNKSNKRFFSSESSFSNPEMTSLLTKVQNLTYERDSLLQEKRNVAMTGFQILLITFCIIIACEFNNRWRQGIIHNL